MGLDKTGLDSRIFDALSVTSRRRYVYACNMQTGVSRWSQHIIEGFDMPGEYFIYSRIQQMTKYEMMIDGNHIPLTVSCGVVKTDHADTGEYTIQASASYALDKSKHSKHGELVFFQDEFQEYSRTTLE